MCRDVGERRNKIRKETRTDNGTLALVLPATSRIMYIILVSNALMTQVTNREQRRAQMTKRGQREVDDSTVISKRIFLHKALQSTK